MRHLVWPSLLAAVFIAAPLAGVQGVAAQPAGSQQDPLAPGPAHETRIVVGEAPPTSFSLRSIDDQPFELAAAEGPLLLVFFRGTW